MKAIILVCPKLNCLIKWRQKGGIHLYFHCPKHTHSWHLMQQVQHSSHLLLWSDPCIAERNFIEGMTSPQTWRGDGLLSWFCRLGHCKSLRGKKLFKIMELRRLCWREMGKRLWPLKNSPFPFPFFGSELCHWSSPELLVKLQFSPLCVCE